MVSISTVYRGTVGQTAANRRGPGKPPRETWQIARRSEPAGETRNNVQQATAASNKHHGLAAADTHQLLALSARHRAAGLVLAAEQALLLVLDDDFVIAEWALLQTVETRSLDLLALLDALVEFEQLRREEPPQLRVREWQLAPGLVHADDPCVVLAEFRLGVRHHARRAEQVRLWALHQLVLCIGCERMC